MLKADYFPIRYEPDNVVAKTPYTIADSVTFEAVLNKGLYWLVPSTYTAGQHSEFIIRFFSDAPLSLVRQPIEPYWKEQVDPPHNIASNDGKETVAQRYTPVRVLSGHKYQSAVPSLHQGVD